MNAAREYERGKTGNHQRNGQFGIFQTVGEENTGSERDSNCEKWLLCESSMRELAHDFLWSDQINNRFDVMSLREHIKYGDGVKRISACNYFAKISRQRRRITRDVADSFWPNLQNAVNDSRFSAGTRRVEQKEVNLECAGLDGALDFTSSR